MNDILHQFLEAEIVLANSSNNYEMYDSFQIRKEHPDPVVRLTVVPILRYGIEKGLKEVKI